MEHSSGKLKKHWCTDF